MGIDGMNSRVKSNLSLKNKSNKYRKTAFTQKVKLEEKIKFKTPTEDDLLKTQKSNRAFLKNEKRKNRILLGLSFFIVTMFYLWFF